MFDTESRTEPMGEHTAQMWRLGAGAWFRGDNRRGWGEPTFKDYARPLDLWVDVNSAPKASHRLVCWAHNLSFDLRVSKALMYLPAMGWELDGIALDHGAGWARFERDGASILFVDLLSWLPAPLHRVAGDLDLTPSPSPAAGQGDDLWAERCRQDVKITTAAVRELLEYVEVEQLGPWRPTGPGQSHSAWRRRWFTHKPLVHDQVAALAAERVAQWTGRCEAWRWGDLPGGPWTEYDLDLAYCQIAYDSEVPSQLVGERPVVDLAEAIEWADRACVLAEVTVRTDSPLVPCEVDGAVLWPVGEFTTTLWDPELRLLHAAGAQVTVDRAWVYRRAPVLRTFAAWIIEQLQSEQTMPNPVQKRMLKHWARAAVGRCAMRYREWEEFGMLPTDDLQLGVFHDRGTGRVTDMMQVGRSMRVLSDMREAPDSLPQIPGWVMSECRRRLWQLVGVAGDREVAYMDTDCLIVTPRGAARLKAAESAGGLWPMHVKGRHKHLVVHGPRMLVVDGARRMAGIPVKAQAGQAGQLRGEVFVSLKEAILRRHFDRVEVIERDYMPELTDRRRLHLTGGTTAPIVVSKATAGCRTNQRVEVAT